MPVWVSTIGFVIAPVTTLIAVWMTSHFAWRRSQNEKLWDRKANAYGAILEALHEMDAWFTVSMNDAMLRRDPSDEIVEERGASYRSARKILRGVVGREVWLLDPAVKERAEAMNKVLDDHYDGWFEVLDAGSYAVAQAIKEITALATRELKTERTH
ncbi:hypothetical protein [Rhizorhapis suberifaciens]|uniref:Uncharacterized protein n=1 Tax=Rhizorhapis suberifaciens TaxID=13656 RepID=A0A840HPK0_9SPHN|nr:hypothetical protein [Rhizorhapis suberifaciens]MBB4639835.1 hypothetical protein [Rhizorhapis suberifaciens]